MELQSLSSTTDNCFTSYFQFSEDSKNHTRHYSHQLMLGSTSCDGHYGIAHAEYCNWSPDIVARAKNIRQTLVAHNDGSRATQLALKQTQNKIRNGTYDTIQKMCMIQKNASSNHAARPVIKELLRSLQCS